MNTRPLLSDKDRETLHFALNSMRDDRNRTELFKDDKRYDDAEELFRRILGDIYTRAY